MRTPSQGIVRYGEAISLKDLEVRDIVPTGCPDLDEPLGGGILKRGMSLIYGPEGVGKSTLALRVISGFQRRGLRCLLFDCDFSLERRWAERNGVDPDYLLVCSDNSELVFQLILRLGGYVDLIVVDSVAGICTDRLTWWTGRLSRFLDCSLLWIGQVRDTWRNVLVREWLMDERCLLFYCGQVVRLGEDGQIWVRKNILSGQGGFVTISGPGACPQRR